MRKDTFFFAAATAFAAVVAFVLWGELREKNRQLAQQQTADRRVDSQNETPLFPDAAAGSPPAIDPAPWRFVRTRRFTSFHGAGSQAE